MSPAEDINLLVVCVSRSQGRHAGLVRVDQQNNSLPDVGTAALKIWLTMAIWPVVCLFVPPGRPDICILMKSAFFFFFACGQ